MLSCEFERSQVLCKSVEAKCSQASIIFAKLSRTSSIEKGINNWRGKYWLPILRADTWHCLNYLPISLNVIVRWCSGVPQNCPNTLHYFDIRLKYSSRGFRTNSSLSFPSKIKKKNLQNIFVSTFCRLTYPHGGFFIFFKKLECMQKRNSI